MGEPAIQVHKLTPGIGAEISGVDLAQPLATLHHAMWDYFPHKRLGYRVTVRGDKPFYRA